MMYEGLIFIQQMALVDHGSAEGLAFLIIFIDLCLKNFIKKI